MAFLLKDYKDFKEIARGGMGKVYLGTQISLNRKVIIKEMASGLLADPMEIRRFENEARAAAALNHDNIIRIYDFGEDRGSFYISMEYIDGADLEVILKSDSYLPEIGLMIVLHALNGLSFAHQQGIIHRDIKPGNILVSKVGAVKVVDFGLAHASHQQLHLTTKDMIVGTPIFMSPEQATGEEKKDSRMDIWSAGILLYRIVTNAYPFTGDNVPALLVKILQDKEPPVQELAPALPDDLADAINRCLDKNRNERLQNLEPLIETLQNYFYDMEIKDTSTWIRRYETDQKSCIKDLSNVLLEYHLRKENEFKAAGQKEKAQAHRKEAEKLESNEQSLNMVRDAIKKRDSSSVFKRPPPRTALLYKTSTWRPAPRRIPWTMYIIVTLVILAAGWFAFSRISKKEVSAPATSALHVIDTGVKYSHSVSKSADTPEVNTPTERKSYKTAHLDHAKSSHTLKPAKTTTSPAMPLPGVLKITVNPASAEVTIDDEKISDLEMKNGKQLKPGTHTLIAKATGYGQFSKTVSIENSTVQIVSANLVPLAKEPGALHIYSSPWAELYIDGVFNGNAPTSKPIYLSEGPHTIMLKRSGFKTYEETVTIANGELRRLKIKLEEEQDSPGK